MARETLIRDIVIRSHSEGVRRAAADLNTLAAAQGTVAQTATTTSRATVGVERALDRLRRSVDSTYRSEQQLAAGQRTLDRALQQGAINAAGYARQMDLLRQKFGQANAAAAKTPFIDRLNVTLQSASAGFTLGGRGGAIAGSVLGGLSGGAGVNPLSVAATVASAGIGAIAQAGSAWTGYANQLTAAGVASKDLAATQRDLASLAIETRSSLDGTINLYARMVRASSDLGVTQEKVRRVTEVLSKGLATSGLSAGEASAGLLQFSQGLQSGRFQGDELRSILENLPMIARAIANEFGVTVGQLRKLGEEGKLTSDRVFQAVLDSGSQIDQVFAKSTPTIEQAMTAAVTSLTRLGAELDRILGISSSVTGALGLISSAASGLADAVSGLNLGLFRFHQLLPKSGPLGFVGIGAELADAAGLATSGASTLPRRPEQQRAEKAVSDAERLRFQREADLRRTAGAAQRFPTAQARDDLEAERVEEAYKKRLEAEKKAASAGSRAGKQSERNAEAFQKELRSIEERTEALRRDAEMLGRSTAEVQKAKVEQDLLNSAQERGITVTDTLRAQIERQAAAYGQAAQDLEKARQSQQGWNDLAEFGGNSLIDVIEGLRSGQDLASILDDITGALIRMALQAAILGQGPLASIFGLGGTGGQPGGLIGSLFFHGGGVVGSPGARRGVVPRHVFAGAPRFHGGLSPREFPAILEAGERVLTKQDSTREMNVIAGLAGLAERSTGTGATPQLTFAPQIQIDRSGSKGDPNDDRRTAAMVQAAVETAFANMLAKQMRPGGMLNPAFGTR